MRFSLLTTTSLLFLGATAAPAVEKRQNNLVCAAGSPGITVDTYNTLVRVFKEKVGEDRTYPVPAAGVCCSGWCMNLGGLDAPAYVSGGDLEVGFDTLHQCAVGGANSAGVDVPDNHGGSLRLLFFVDDANCQNGGPCQGLQQC